ncbi:MAG: NAD(P)/FAD-dependent oxidoreductase [Desulfobulbus sp.]|jgi:flavin-dependent dehydrogenase
MEKTEVLVVGGGPGGLACATRLAGQGMRVVLVERKVRFGDKVCAGGITMNGLLRSIPSNLIERRFSKQFVVSPRQQMELSTPHPTVATVNRERLAAWMREQAEAAGVIVLIGTRVVALEPGRATLETDSGRRRLAFTRLVGADGANSRVRRFFGVPVSARGLGVQGMYPMEHPRMEWHLDANRFGVGYAWVFPHGTECSIGAYTISHSGSGRRLKEALLRWAGDRGWRLDPERLRAGLINFDYRGFRFPGGWLVGEAAGLVSGLTGEGIFPAMVSGQAVADEILGKGAAEQRLQGLLRRQKCHHRLTDLADRSRWLCGTLMESTLLLLRLRLLDFRKLEMTAPGFFCDA